MMTTSYVHKQAYEEVIQEADPILIVSACDITRILRSNSIISSSVDAKLASLGE